MLDAMKRVLPAPGWVAGCVALCAVFLSCPATARQAAVAHVASATPAPVPSSDSEAPAPVAPASDALPSDGPRAIREQDAVNREVERVADETDPSALTRFRPVLAPYGVWMQDPTWGLVWVPNASLVGSGFAPYVTSGHWALSEHGEWIWVSELPFGWVVFHYGRWVSISGVGWAWIPGRRYAPAWVSWRVPHAGYDYVGWGPLPPSWVWVNGAAVVVSHPPPTAYVFCPSYYALHRYPYGFFVRDPVLVVALGHHTHRWARYHHFGPSLAEARIPARAVPRHRVAAFTRSERLHRATNERGLRQSRTLASPAVAGPSLSTRQRAQPNTRASASVRARAPRASASSTPVRASRVPDTAPHRRVRVRDASQTDTAAARNASTPRQEHRARLRTRSDRTPGRSVHRSGPGRGFMPRVAPSTGAPRRR